MNDEKDPIMRLNPQKVAEYLRKHNWKCTHVYPDNRSTLWEKDGRSGRLIPDKTLYDDYRQVMLNLIHTIAEVDRPAEVDLYGIMPTIEEINRVYDVYNAERIIFLIIFSLIIALLLIILYALHPAALAFGFVLFYAVFMFTFTLMCD